MSTAAPRDTTAIPHDESRAPPGPSSDMHSRGPEQPVIHHSPAVASRPPPSEPAGPYPSSSPLVHFRTTTVAPSPPQQHPDYIEAPGNAHAINDSAVLDAGHHRIATPLRIATDLGLGPSVLSSSPSHLENLSSGSNLSPTRGMQSVYRKTSTGSLRAVSRTPSLKAALAHSVNNNSGTNSLVPSPIISAMGDMTPLPSPLMSGDSPGPWKLLRSGSVSPPHGRDRLRIVGEGSVLVTTSGESIDSALSNGPKRKLFTTTDGSQLGQPPPANSQEAHQHTRNRSISDYHPDPKGIPKRQVTVSGSHVKLEVPESQEQPQMRRELNLAESRGLMSTVAQPPTPPPSESSKDSLDGLTKTRDPCHEYFEARERLGQKRRRWRCVRILGQGTFSRVMLATSHTNGEDDADNLALVSKLDRKTLVAVKVCEHGPRGGASEERVEMSLKRELEIMQGIHHPSLVDLKAWSIEPTRAILVLGYCPGGDLFDVATSHRDALSPSLLRRVFAELVSAVQYLHEKLIVHRDIKLENVLVNLTPDELQDPAVDWNTYPYSVSTLTDLGLSRRIAEDEKLETRCGSEDYAAPEVIMGQPYDGRATDAWSLGVLLYALLEARLPFDPHPGMSDAHRMRSRTSHRIARVEWRWVDYAGDDGDHDGNEAKFQENGLLGAMEITEGLLKRARSRWSIDRIAKQPWVRGAMQIDGGLRFREEEAGEEVS